MDMELDLDYIQMIKRKRQRECNWDRSEKRTLMRLVNQYRSIVDNRGNDALWLRKKTAAWDTIHRGMIASGCRRGVKSIRQQWARMKVEAKKKEKTVKKEVIDIDTQDTTEDDETVNKIPDPETGTGPSDCIIKTEYEAEEPNLASDKMHAETNPPINENGSPPIGSIIMPSIPHPNDDRVTSPVIASTTSSNGAATEPLLPPPMPAKRFVRIIRPLPPKNLLSRDVLEARVKQIEQETTLRYEMHILDVTHKKALHLLDIAQRKEIHALRVQKLRDEIEQQRNYFETS